ncbi:MAG TPA: hypothetical protein VFX12_07775 [Vicinamibacterales bacterium]|nr:hypothetical protein [Vicinamibacterales bacterium]
MGSIRVGFFEDFKGANTLLIDVDAQRLRRLIARLAGPKLALRRKLARAKAGGPDRDRTGDLLNAIQKTPETCRDRPTQPATVRND